jgi:hypothetical protein
MYNFFKVILFETVFQKYCNCLQLVVIYINETMFQIKGGEINAC